MFNLSNKKSNFNRLILSICIVFSCCANFLYAFDDTRSPTSIYEYRNEIFYNLNSAKNAVKAYVEQTTGIYPDVLRPTTSDSTYLRFYPEVYSEPHDPFQHFAPGSNYIDDYLNRVYIEYNLSASINYWEQSFYDTPGCPNTTLKNIQTKPLVFQWWSTYGNYAHRYYRATFNAIAVTYEPHSCDKIETAVDRVFTQHDVFQCPHNLNKKPNTVGITEENVIPRCTYGETETIKVSKSCPLSHPIPIKKRNTIEVCVKNTCPMNQPNNGFVGNPISCSTGEKVQVDSIYEGTGADALKYSTYYSSQEYDIESGSLIGQFASLHGQQRNDNMLNRIEQIYNTNGIKIYQVTRRGIHHTYSGNDTATNLKGSVPTSGNLKINNDGTFTQILPNGTTYDFNVAGLLTNRTLSNGKTRTYDYDTLGKLIRVTNHYGKSLQFFYNSQNLLERLETPDQLSYRFEYDVNGNMTSISYPDETPNNLTDNPSIQFLYEDTRFPNHLTGKINEKGVRYASWTYDEEGRAISSEHGQNLEKVELDYSFA